MQSIQKNIDNSMKTIAKYIVNIDVNIAKYVNHIINDNVDLSENSNNESD